MAPPQALTFLLIIPLLSGCLSNELETVSEEPVNPPIDDQRLTPEEWKKLLSKPKYEGRVDSIEHLEAEDGTHLSLSLYLPGNLPQGARIPTLMEITPYQAGAEKNDDLAIAGLETVSDHWEEYILRGAAFVRANARGSAGSGGCLDFGGNLDRSDAVAFVEWVRAQPWSNGVVVTDGLSHPGMGSIVAHAAVPGLGGALAHAPVVSYYRDGWYQGARFEEQPNGPAYQAIELVPPVDPDPESLASQVAPCTGQTVLDFEQPTGVFGELWQDRDLSRHFEYPETPLLMTQGFVDGAVHPDHVQLYWESLPETAEKRMILGWWGHDHPDLQGYSVDDFKFIRHRYLDTLLFGINNGLAAEPRVLVEDSTGAWHESHEWPLDGSEDVTWVTGDGTLGESGSTTALSYDDDPRAARGTWVGAHVAFRSEPFLEDRLVNGAPAVHLVASSTASATKWVVYLLDEGPDGSWQRISHGYADSHTYGAETEWLELTPDKAEEWDVQLMPTAVVVPAGHRVTLLVASTDLKNANILPTTPYTCFDDHNGGCYSPSGIRPSENTGIATNTVLAGPAGTTVTLSLADPSVGAIPKK